VGAVISFNLQKIIVINYIFIRSVIILRRVVLSLKNMSLLRFFFQKKEDFLIGLRIKQMNNMQTLMSVFRADVILNYLVFIRRESAGCNIRIIKAS